MQEDHNKAKKDLSDYFDLVAFADRVSNNFPKVGIAAYKISNTPAMRSEIQGFTLDAIEITFNKLRHKGDRRFAVFGVEFRGGHYSYWEFEMVNDLEEIAVVDYYDYLTGTWLSEVVGQGMGIANRYRNVPDSNIPAYNLETIFGESLKQLEKGNITAALASFNKLTDADKALEIADYFRVTIALTAGDSVYLDELNKMMLEQKRDPRFFYYHQVNMARLKGDYAQAVKHYEKLCEHTGKNFMEMSELAIYQIFAGEHESAGKSIEELIAINDENAYPYSLKLISLYLQGNREEFDQVKERTMEKYDLSGYGLYWETMEYLTIPANVLNVDSMKLWYFDPEAID